MVFTPTPGFDQIAREKIFPGESGGDYDAIFGYANRDPNSPFYGVRPTQMTVGQMIDFTQPSGAYGQWVKGQIGRVATPVGGFQVVGTTLRDVVSKMGIDPNTPFNQQTQNLIGDYIYQTQGPSAWEAWGHGGGGGGSGGQTMATRNQTNPLGYMEGGEDFPLYDPGMTGRDRFATALVGAGEMFGSLGAGRAADFSKTDRWMQGEAKRRAMQEALKRRQEAATAAADKAPMALNQTLTWLQSQGHADLIDAVSTGVLSPGDAVKEALSRDPAAPPLPEGQLTDDQFKMATTMRDTALRQFAPYQIIENSFRQMGDVSQLEGGAADLALGTTLMKVLDPNSVVRESELALALNSTGLLDKLFAQLQGVGGDGSMLDKGGRETMLRVAEALYSGAREEAEKKYQYWSERALAQGIDPIWVVDELRDPYQINWSGIAGAQSLTGSDGAGDSPRPPAVALPGTQIPIRPNGRAAPQGDLP